MSTWHRSVTTMTATDLRAPLGPVPGWDALRWLRSRIRLRAGRVLVGIDGLAGSGKTSFADELGTLISECGLEVVRLTLDAYLTAAAMPTEAALDSVVEDVLRPLARDGSGRYRTTPLGAAAARWACAAEAAVVIVDGRFLHHPTLLAAGTPRIWDYSVWLEVPIEQAYARLHQLRDSDPDPRAPSNLASTTVQLQYIAACDPAGHADLVVDNSRPHASTD